MHCDISLSSKVQDTHDTVSFLPRQVQDNDNSRTFLLSLSVVQFHDIHDTVNFLLRQVQGCLLCNFRTTMT